MLGTNFFTPAIGSVQVALADAAGNAVLIKCTAANLPASVAGYAVGCIAEATDTGVCYSNTGSATSATFTAFNSASALTLPSAFTDAVTTTGNSMLLTESGITTGKGIKVLNNNTTNFTTGGALFYGDLSTATAGNGLVVIGTGAYTGTGLAVLTTGAMTTGIGLSVISTTGLTSGSLIRATSSTAGAIATNGAISFVASGAFTTTASTLGFVHVAGASTVTGTIMSILGGAQTTGIALNITDPSAGMTSGSLLRVISATTGAVATNGVVSFQSSAAFTSTTIGFVNIISSGATAGTTLAIQNSASSQTASTALRIDQTGTTTGYTGNLVAITGSSTTGASNLMLITGVHTTAGNALKIIANAITLGAATGLLVSHTTSVLGAGSSLVRISSTGADTGTTTGVLLDLSTTAAAGSTQILLTDSSADTAARIGMLLAVTNSAAVGAIPLQISNVAVTSTHFVPIMQAKNGATVITVWLSDNTDPNGALSGTAGDICYNGATHKPAYCTGTTTWVNFV